MCIGDRGWLIGRGRIELIVKVLVTLYRRVAMLLTPLVSNKIIDDR